MNFFFLNFQKFAKKAIFDITSELLLLSKMLEVQLIFNDIFRFLLNIFLYNWINSKTTSIFSEKMNLSARSHESNKV